MKRIGRNARQVPDVDMHKYLIADPVEGIFIWKRRDIDCFETQRACSTWNARYAGKIAGGRMGTVRYLIITINNVHYMAHRVMWEMVNGPIPDGLSVDHIDGQGMNNRISNLRVCTHQQNRCNTKLPSNNKTGFKGVHFFAPLGKYRASINIKRKCKFLGTFDTPQEAHKAYCNAALTAHGEYARFE